MTGRSQAGGSPTVRRIAPGTRGLQRLPARVLLFLLQLYRTLLSPFLGSNCRFAPSCSAYAAAAIDRYGAVRGTHLAILRLLRCHPWSEGGWDPVS